MYIFRFWSVPAPTKITLQTRLACPCFKPLPWPWYISTVGGMVYCWFHWLYKAVLTAGQQLLSILIGRVGDVLDVFCCDGRPSVLGMWFTKEWACVFLGGDDGDDGVVDVDLVADSWLLVRDIWMGSVLVPMYILNAISYASSTGHSNLICLFSEEHTPKTGDNNMFHLHALDPPCPVGSLFL